MAVATELKKVSLLLDVYEAELLCALLGGDVLVRLAKATVTADKIVELHRELDAVLPDRTLTFEDFFEEE